MPIFVNAQLAAPGGETSRPCFENRCLISGVVHDSALSEIARIGYSPVFGARPLRQTISENIRSVLAEKILKREIIRGQVVSVLFDGTKFVWKMNEDGV